MPRRRAAPRLYLDPGRRQWVVRDGPDFVRTGCVESNRGGAEKFLGRYLARKHTPERGPAPLIADVLAVYAREHVPYIAGRQNTAYNLGNLARFWGDKKLSEVTAANCRAYAAGRPSDGGARRDLEVLRAAMGYWHKNYGPLPAIPIVTLPARAPPKDRWLTRSEAARLLWAARRTPHLARFILIGLYTGSRPGAVLGLTWEQVDLAAGVLHRKPAGRADAGKKRSPPVRLGRRIQTHLRRWQRECGAYGGYVCHYDGRGVAKLRRSFPQAVARAGLGAGVTPHTLRHTRATWLMQAGVGIWEAAGHLGMTPEVLEKVYGHHSAEWQKRAAEV